MQNNNLTELSLDDLAEAAGGVSIEWSTATATSAALLAGAVTVSAPLLAGAFAVGSIIASGTAIWYALEEDNQVSQ